MEKRALINVSIVEDDRATRERLSVLINREKHLKVLATYPTAEAAVRDIPIHPPDVALVDINLPGMNGIEAVGKLKAQLPGLRILILTTYEESDLIFDSLRTGASGYLLKKLVPSELIPALEQVHSGGAPMSLPIARKVVDYFHRTPKSSSPVDSLTEREHEILQLIAEGHLYKEIGDRLGIAISTVATHLQHIYEKLHVRSRTEAAVKFFQHR